MGSAARRRGAHGGEFSPTGLRLFAWWKKETGQHLRANSVKPKTQQRTSLFIADWNLQQGLGQSCIARTPSQAAATIDRIYLVRACIAGKVVSCQPRAAGPAARPSRVQPTPRQLAQWPSGPPEHAQRARHARGDRWPPPFYRWSEPSVPWPLALFPFFPFLFLYLFILNK
jgi:hypothetical protein